MARGKANSCGLAVMLCIAALIEAFWSSYLAAEYKDVATFSILILVLMFRPSGLLGRPEVEKV